MASGALWVRVLDINVRDAPLLVHVADLNGEARPFWSVSWTLTSVTRRFLSTSRTLMGEARHFWSVSRTLTSVRRRFLSASRTLMAGRALWAGVESPVGFLPFIASVFEAGIAPFLASIIVDVPFLLADGSHWLLDGFECFSRSNKSNSQLVAKPEVLLVEKAGIHPDHERCRFIRYSPGRCFFVRLVLRSLRERASETMPLDFVGWLTRAKLAPFYTREMRRTSK